MTADVHQGPNHPALERLGDHLLLRGRAYIDGRWRASSSTFVVQDPASGMIIQPVAALGAGETREAVDAASRALPAWRHLLPQERSRRLRQWHDLVLAAQDDLALLVTLEQGKPLAEARGEIAYGASFLEWYAEEARRLNVESVTSHLQDAEMIVRREPLGVAALVTPWNFPIAMLTRKAAAALAAGCTVVAHPSAKTPLSALALAALAERAGLPGGVFNLVTGDGATIVNTLCDDKRVAVMSFTGSTAVGQQVAARCGSTMKRLVMELGGHAPFLVFADADLGHAAETALAAKFTTAGQDCLAANRIYVERPVYDRFCQAFKTRVGNLKVAHGLVEDADIGPLMHEDAVRKIEAQIEDALARGARCLIGGGRHLAGPRFFQPTILADVPDDALIMREETFGPVAAVTPFDREDEVVARANATAYGLIAYVVTTNGARQLRLGRALEFGMVAINRVKVTGAPVPFGGIKLSGLGREGARLGLEAFTELKYLCIETSS